MNTQKRIRKITAVLLAFLLAVPGSVAAFADDVTETVYVSGEDVTVDGNIMIHGDGSALGAEVYSAGVENNSSLTVKGDVTVLSAEGDALGIYAGGESGAETTVNAGDVAAMAGGQYTEAKGLEVSASRADVTVETGEVDAIGQFGAAVTVEASGESTVNIRTGEAYSTDMGVDIHTVPQTTEEGEFDAPTVDVNTQYTDGTGLGVLIDNQGGDVKVTVDGNLKSETAGIQASESGFTCIVEIGEEDFKPENPDERYGEWTGEPDEDGSYTFSYYCYGADGTTFIVEGIYNGLTGETTYRYLKEEEAFMKGTSTIVNVKGDVLVQGVDASYAWDAYSQVPGSSIAIFVGGKVAVEGEDTYWIDAISQYAGNGSTVYSVILEGVDVNKTSGNGILVEASEKSDAGLLADGDFTFQVNDQEHSTAISARADEGSNATVYFGGTLDALNESGTLTGLEVIAGPDSKAAADVGEDVIVVSYGKPNEENEGTAGAVTAQSFAGETEATAEVQVSGNVDFFGTDGSAIDTKNYGGEISVTVDGSVKSSFRGVNATSEVQEAGDQESVLAGYYTTNVEIGGDLIVEGEEAAQAIGMTSDTTGDMEVKVGGGVILQQGEEGPFSTDGIMQETYGGGRVYTEIWEDANLDMIDGFGISQFATGEDSKAELLIMGDVNFLTPGDSRASAIFQDVSSGGAVRTVITGDVNAENSEDAATGIEMYLGDDASSVVVIGGNITAKGTDKEEDTWLDNYGIYIETFSEDNPANANVSVYGDVTAAGRDSTGVDVSNMGGNAKVYVAGDVNATGRGIDASAFYDEASASDTVKITVDGNVNVDGDAARRGIEAEAYTPDSSVSVAVQGDVTFLSAETRDSILDVTAAEADAYNGAEASVEIGGNVTAKAVVDDSEAIRAEARDEGSTAKVDVGGDVDFVFTAEGGEGYAIKQTARDDGHSSVQIQGDVSASGEASFLNGITVKASDGGTAVTDVFGSVDITPGEDEGANGIFVGTDDADSRSEAAVAVHGDLRVGGESSSAITAESNGGAITIDVGGSVNSEGDGIRTRQEGYASGETETRVPLDGDVNISIYGDLAARRNAIDAMASGEENETSISVGGDVNMITGDAYATAVSAESSEGADLTIEIGGSMNILALHDTEEDSPRMPGMVTGIEADAYETSTGLIFVDGDVNVVGTVPVYGIKATAYDSGFQAVSVDGNVQVMSGENSATAVAAATELIGEPGKSKPGVAVHVGGDIYTEHVGDRAILAENMTGNITVSVEGNAEGTILARQNELEDAAGYHYFEGETKISVEGDVSASGNYDVTTVSTSSFSSGFETEIEIGGDVTAVSNGYATAIDVYARESEAEVEVGGDVSADGDWYSYAVFGVATENGDAEIEVDGGVSANQAPTAPEGEEEYDFDPENGAAYGVSTVAYDGGQIRVTVLNDVDATAFGTAVGIETIVADEQSEARVSVAGNIRAEGSTDKTAAILTDVNNGGESRIFVYGDVESNQTGLSLHDTKIGERTAEEAGGKTDIEIIGDVTAGDTAVKAELTNENSAMDILVDGTVAGAEHAVLLSDETIMDNVTLTVWEIRQNEDGSVAERYRETQDEEGKTEREILGEDEEFEKKIQYIIRLEQPDVGALDTDGTRDYRGYDVANEGDTITLKIDVPFRYELTNAFNGTDTKVALTKNDDGEYFLIVPRGGAVLLSVEMQYIKPEAEKNRDIVNRVTETVGEGYDVEVANDPVTNEKIVIIRAEEGAEKVELAFDLLTIRSLDYNDAKVISIQSNDGSSKVELKVAEARQALRNAPGSELIVETDMTVEVVKAIREKIEEEYEITEGVTEVVKIVLRDASGLETEVPGVHVMLKLQAENKPEMKWLYVDHEGEISDAEAEWVEGNGTEAGFWRVKYVGYGCYIPVVPKTAK